jgi:hypothetical protein
MQPVINNQPARINQQAEITQEPLKANFANLDLKFIAAGTVANFVTKDNAGELPIPKLLQRNVQTLAQYKSYPIVQQLISRVTNAFATRDYQTLKKLSELGCKLTEDQLETLVQENISKIDSYVLEEGGEKFITIVRAIECCDLYGAELTQEQLNNFLEKAISLIDGPAIRQLLRLGATRPSIESLNQLLQNYLDQNVIGEEIYIGAEFMEILTANTWNAIMGELSIEANLLLNQKLQEAINNGDSTTIRKIRGFLRNNLTQDELNQAFQVAFNKGYTDSKHLECILSWISLGARADDIQIDLINKEIINQKALYALSFTVDFFSKTNISQKVDVLCELVNVDPSSTTSIDQISNILYLLSLIIEDVNNKKQITNDQIEICIRQSLDLGLSLVTNFFLKTNNCNKELTKGQLDYGLQQNLKLFQTKYDVIKWLDMGSSIQEFEQCFEKFLQDNDLLKILNLFSISSKIQQLNHIVKKQEYIDAAVKKGISQLASVDLLALKHDDGVTYPKFTYDYFEVEMLDALNEVDLLDALNNFNELTLGLGGIPLYHHRTIPGYFISNLLMITFTDKQIEQINELYPLLLETVIDKLDFGTIESLVEDMNYKLTNDQRDKIKQNLLSQGIPSNMSINRASCTLDILNITFTQEELNTGYAKALQDSHSTFDIWKSLGAKPIFEETDQ